MVKKLNKTLIALGVGIALTASGVFAQVHGAKGAGIGHEVSREAKILKNSENKTNFGKEVRELAHDKERIEQHKIQQKIKKEKKKTKVITQ